MSQLQFWLNILAVIAGPILAVQAQKWLERRREDRARKLFIFRELMTTRAARLSQRHVEALNLIDIEYPGDKAKDKGVHEAWRSYLDALSAPNDASNQDVVFERRQRTFIELMHKMAQRLDFPFDRVAIERNIYSPIAHGKLEDDQELIRLGVVELLTGKRALSTISWVMPGQAPLQVTQVAHPETPPAAAAEQPQPRQALPPARVKRAPQGLFRRYRGDLAGRVYPKLRGGFQWSLEQSKEKTVIADGEAATLEGAMEATDAAAKVEPSSDWQLEE
jgi:hypothetical protein